MAKAIEAGCPRCGRGSRSAHQARIDGGLQAVIGVNAPRSTTRRSSCSGRTTRRCGSADREARKTATRRAIRKRWRRRLRRSPAPPAGATRTAGAGRRCGAGARDGRRNLLRVENAMAASGRASAISGVYRREAACRTRSNAFVRSRLRLPRLKAPPAHLVARSGRTATTAAEVIAVRLCRSRSTGYRPLVRNAGGSRGRRWRTTSTLSASRRSRLPPTHVPELKPRSTGLAAASDDRGRRRHSPQDYDALARGVKRYFPPALCFQKQQRAAGDAQRRLGHAQAAECGVMVNARLPKQSCPFRGA